MDFFVQQEKAKRNTLYLVFLYCLSIIGIIAITYGIVFLYFTHGRVTEIIEYCSNYNFQNQYCSQLFNLKILASVASGVLILIFFGSVWKLIALSRGGAYVAQSLGARLVDRSTNDPLERRLLNVVEEMSIAAGIAVPDTYIMDSEEAINAFAAGYGLKDAVVSVTKGTLVKLNRDELQGVIGHEFSHILNGDMKLNIRLIAILNGILCISLVGRILMDFRSRSYRSYDRDRKDPLAALPVIGLLLYLVGYLGVFFGSLIKSAVSRQREFLADATSVQFTRNPLGLSSALKKIGGYSQGSKINNGRAEEVSHMFFSDGLSRFFFSLFATHPPLITRIRKLEPDFKGEFSEPADDGLHFGAEELHVGLASAGNKNGLIKEQVVSRIGALNAENIKVSTEVLASLVPKIKAGVSEVGPALAILMSLFISEQVEIREKQFEHISDKTLLALINEYEPEVRKIKNDCYLQIFELLLPTIRLLPAKYLEEVIQELKYLSEVDNDLTLFEYVLVVIVQAATRQVRNVSIPGVLYHRVSDLGKELQVVLSAIAYSGNELRENAIAAYQEAMSSLRLSVKIAPKEDCTLKNIDAALNRLERASMEIKKKIVEACIVCVYQDQKVLPAEEQLLRAVYYVLDCPMAL